MDGDYFCLSDGGRVRIFVQLLRVRPRRPRCNILRVFCECTLEGRGLLLKAENAGFRWATVWSLAKQLPQKEPHRIVVDRLRLDPAVPHACIRRDQALGPGTTVWPSEVPRSARKVADPAEAGLEELGKLRPMPHVMPGPTP